MRKATVGSHQPLRVLRRYFDMITEHGIVSDLERSDPGAVAILGLE